MLYHVERMRKGQKEWLRRNDAGCFSWSDSLATGFTLIDASDYASVLGEGHTVVRAYHACDVAELVGSAIDRWQD